MDSWQRTEDLSIEGQAKRMISTSCDDLKCSLSYDKDIDLLRIALSLVEERGEKTKANLIRSRIRKLAGPQ